jgi:hypothetical protein
MKSVRVVAILGALALAVPAAAMAQTSSTKTQKSTAAATTTAAKKPAKPVTASAKGVVKSTDATSLVIAHSSTKGPDQSFVLDSSTEKHGDLAVGSTVDVKYRVEDGKKIATVVTVEAKKAPAKSKSTKKSGK